jgi:DNA-binding NarL/FixJ family response regulator
MADMQAGTERVKGVAIRVDGKEFTLSALELRVIALVVAGYNYQDMARQFSLNASTISRRTSRILHKLGVANRLELVLFAIQHGLVAPVKSNPD